MINAELLGRRIAEAIINEPGPCFYPGRFKPPHKEHFEAAKDLASRDYVQMVYIIISSKIVDGITPEDSLAIWNIYLDAEPNPKITVRISTEQSPIVDIIKYLNKNKQVDPVYVSVGDDEVDDINYGKSLQEQFGDRVKIIKVQEKAGQITAPHIRNLLAAGDYEGFIEAVPESAYNRGAGPKIFKMLAPKTEA
jgi:hypothetical protein